MTAIEFKIGEKVRTIQGYRGQVLAVRQDAHLAVQVVEVEFWHAGRREQMEFRASELRRHP